MALTRCSVQFRSLHRDTNLHHGRGRRRGRRVEAELGVGGDAGQVGQVRVEGERRRSRMVPLRVRHDVHVGRGAGRLRPEKGIQLKNHRPDCYRGPYPDKSSGSEKIWFISVAHLMAVIGVGDLEPSPL